jgi:Periplasmic glycine betaine/choline-binding (lipo)protein of an ABC-type transport system (osmoprotectant binding protein)
MNPRLAEQLQRLPDFLGSHMLLTLTALGVGIALSVPLTLLSLRWKPLQAALLGTASVIQTIPSLALLALMVPLLGRIGFVPAAIALILYSLLPILRNAVIGIEGTDPNLMEAARGVGMTPAQALWRVQLPLAMPVILAGVRTATVWVVGTATLSTPVGATSLGNYIFTGLQTQNPTAVLVGCVAAAALALLLDGLIRLTEAGAARHSRPLLVAAGLGLALVVGGALWPTVRNTLRQNRNAATGPRVVVGAKSFTEQYILADLLGRRLDRAGFDVQTTPGMGSSILFDSLANGTVQVYVDYSGTLWANVLKRNEAADPATVLAQTADALKERYGITLVGPLGFENAYALAMRRDQAEKLGIETVGDLVAHAGRLTIGGDYEFFGRPEWKAMRAAYGFTFKNRVRMDAALMYPAIRTGDVDVISAFSSDGRIAAYDLKVLKDTKQALPPYDAVLLVSKGGAQIPGLLDSLRPLVGSIPDDLMRNANKIVDVDKGTVTQAAAYLDENLVEGNTPEAAAP